MDAMVFCHTHYDPDTVYNWDVDEFEVFYHSLMRIESRASLKTFSRIQQAFGGDKKSIKAYVDGESVWLPSQEKNGGHKGVDDLLGFLKKGVKLAKK